MAGYNKTLKLIAIKLGLGEEGKVLNKAAEFVRLLQTKSIAGSNMTDTSKTVICLDLAAAVIGVDLDNKTAVKYSGLKGSTYMNCRKIVENLLELNSNKLTISFLCLTLQCMGVQSLAENILDDYQRRTKTEIDLSLPQYVCMAVHQACRLKKVKVAKSKFIEKSRLKPGQWAKLDADWTKVVDEKFATFKKKNKSNDVVEINNETENREVDTQSPCNDSAEAETEPYEDWKKRMLEIAYKQKEILKGKELMNYKTKENKSDDKEVQLPRRSPRKTPQKFSPYKSPTKKPGVRLLFQNNY